jgi:hypothetical protein
MLGHLRTEAYPRQRKPIYPGGATDGKPPTIDGNEAAIRVGKERV